MILSSSFDTLTPQQHRAVHTRQTSVVLSSGAGCGKTHVLTERYLAHLRDDAAEVGQVVAITFTDRAARQMRGRIRKAVEDNLRAADPDDETWARHLRNLETAPISTIHAFCAALLRQNAVEAALDPRFDVLEEVLSVNIEAEALNSCLQRLLIDQTGPGEDLRRLVLLYGWRPVVEAVQHLLRSRDEASWRTWLNKPPEQVAEGWCDFARRSLRPRWVAHLLAARPRVTRCLDQLRRHPPAPGPMADNVRRLLDELPRLAEATDLGAAVKEFHELAKVGRVGKKAWPDSDVYESIKTAFEKLREELNGWGLERFDATAEALREAVEVGRRTLRVAGEVVAAYRDRKRVHGVVDFQDLLTAARDLLRDHPAVRARLRERYRFLLIDELQDTDPVQMELIDSLCGDGTDGRQAVRRGRRQPVDLPLPRGRRASISGAAREDAAGRATEPDQKLPQSARHPRLRQRPVLPMSDRLPPAGDRQPADQRGAVRRVPVGAARRGRRRQGRRHGGPRRRGRPHRRPHRRAGARPGGDRGGSGGRPDADAAGAARRRGAAVPGDEQRPPVRSGPAQAGTRLLPRRRPGLFAQQEIYDILNLLRALENPQDGLSLAGVLRSPFCCLSDEALFVLGRRRDGLWAGLCDETAEVRLPADQREPVRRARRHLQRWRGLKDRLPIARLLGAVFADSGYDAATQLEFLGDRKLANLWKLQDLARTFDRSGLFGLAEFIARLGDLVRNQPREEQAATLPENADVIRMMTIHQAKGLEFPVVIVPDLAATGHGGGLPVAQWDRGLGCVVKPPVEDGEVVFPDFAWKWWQMQSELEDWQEDLRTLYVACTRARDYLILSSSLADGYQPAGPWMLTLAGRFDLESGRCLAPDVAEGRRPAVEVHDSRPPAARP